MVYETFKFEDTNSVYVYLLKYDSSGISMFVRNGCSMVDKTSASTTNKSYVYILNSNVCHSDESIWEYFYGGYMYSGKHINRCRHFWQFTGNSFLFLHFSSKIIRKNLHTLLKFEIL